MGRGKGEAGFRISFTPRAYRHLARLLKTDEDLAKRVSEKIDSLPQQPMLGKPLTGPLKGSRSLRIGNYRVIYRIDTSKREVQIMNMGHRRRIY